MEIFKGMMGISPDQEQLVRKYGHRVERFIKSGYNGKANWIDTEYEANILRKRNRLTPSERLGAKRIMDTFDIEFLRRPKMGTDFVYGNVGFEVKSHQWYRLSERQIEHMSLLDVSFVIVSNDTKCYIHREIR